MNMNKYKKRTRAILIVLLSLFTSSACLYTSVIYLILPIYGMFGNGCPSIFAVRIEQEAHFRLPPSARKLQSFCIGMQGWVAVAKFEMVPEDLDTLIDSTEIMMPLSEKYAPENLLNAPSRVTCTGRLNMDGSTFLLIRHFPKSILCILAHQVEINKEFNHESQNDFACFDGGEKSFLETH